MKKLYGTDYIKNIPDIVNSNFDEAILSIGGKINNTAGAVQANNIASSAVTAGKIASNAVTEVKINTGAVTSGKIGSSAVTEAKIGTNAVTSGKIASNAVTEAKINTGAVTSGKIGSSAVTEAKIGTGAVTETKIGTNAVTNAKIASNAITEAKIASGAVTAYKIGANAIITNRIADGNVTESKLSGELKDKLASYAIDYPLKWHSFELNPGISGYAEYAIDRNSVYLKVNVDVSKYTGGKTVSISTVPLELLPFELTFNGIVSMSIGIPTVGKLNGKELQIDIPIAIMASSKSYNVQINGVFNKINGVQYIPVTGDIRECPEFNWNLNNITQENVLYTARSVDINNIDTVKTSQGDKQYCFAHGYGMGFAYKFTGSQFAAYASSHCRENEHDPNAPGYVEWLKSLNNHYVRIFRASDAPFSQDVIDDDDKIVWVDYVRYTDVRDQVGDWGFMYKSPVLPTDTYIAVVYYEAGAVFAGAVVRKEL